MPVVTDSVTLAAAAIPVVGAGSSSGTLVSAVDAGPFWTQVAGQTISAFDVAAIDAVSSWSYYNGSEFPGASGALAETVGMSGKGAKLTYNLSCGKYLWVVLPSGQSCGRYVAMQLNKLPGALTYSATDLPTVAFDVRNLRATASPTLRVIDSTGQTHQFRTSARPLENHLGTQWSRVQVPVGTSTLHWGGANDGKLHQPIKAVSLMADEVALPSPSGDLEVDNLTYLPTSETNFTLKANAPLSSMAYPSTYVGHLGVVWRPKFGYAALDKAVAAGLNVVRFDMTWPVVEVKGKFDFTYFSNIATELAKRNVKVLFILAYGHPDHGGTAPLTDADQAAYAEFARRAALAFKGRNVAGFELWNEPNLAGFWPNPDPVAYSKLLAATVTAIRTVDTTVPIVSAGIADADYSYMMNMLRSGNLKGVSAIGVHPYRMTGAETFAAQLPTLNQMVGAVGLNVPFWDTEWGYSSFRDVGDISIVGDGHDSRAQRRQAILNLRKMLTSISVNLPLSILYELVDEGTDPLNREHNFGLLNSILGDKPGMVGARALYAAQNGRVLKGLLPNVPPGLHVLRWDGSADKAFVVWSDAPSGARTKITLPGTATQVQLWDGSKPGSLTATKQLYLQESDGPVFITVPN